MLTGSSPDKFSSPSQLVPFHDSLASVRVVAAAALQGVREGGGGPKFEGLHAWSSEQRATTRPPPFLKFIETLPVALFRTTGGVYRRLLLTDRNPHENFGGA